MGRNDLDGRLATLESATTAKDKRLRDDDPRVIAYRKKASSLGTLTEELGSGIKEWERLDLLGRVQYWREKVAEAEFLIDSNGVADDDDIAALTMSEFTLQTIQELSFEIACESIDEYRQMPASAHQENNSGEFLAIAPRKS